MVLTPTSYNKTVGHTGIARLCLAHWCYRTRTKPTEVREAPTSTGRGGCHVFYAKSCVWTGKTEAFMVV